MLWKTGTLLALLTLASIFVWAVVPYREVSEADYAAGLDSRGRLENLKRHSRDQARGLESAIEILSECRREALIQADLIQKAVEGLAGERDAR